MLFRNILLNLHIFGYNPDIFLLLSSNCTLSWVRKHMLYEFNPFTFIESIFWPGIYGPSQRMFRVPLKVLLLLGGASVNLNLINVVGSFVQAFSIVMTLCLPVL